MNRKKISPKNPTKKIQRTGDPIPWRYGFLTLLCGLVLVIGFFFAARQHFSAIDFSIKNSRLKKQIDELEIAKRRLQLDKAIALTPAEIKKAARKIGLTETVFSNKTTENLPAKKSNDTLKPEQPKEVKTEEVKKELNKAEKEEKIQKKPQKTDTKKDTPPASLTKDQIFTRKRQVDDKRF